MLQEIITYLIIITAFFITIYKTVQFFTQKKSKNKCFGCTNEMCAIKENFEHKKQFHARGITNLSDC